MPSPFKALIEEKVTEEEAFRARIAVNASNRQERGPRRTQGGTEYTPQEAAALLQAEDDSWDAQPKSEPKAEPASQPARTGQLSCHTMSCHTITTGRVVVSQTEAHEEIVLIY